MIVEHGRSLEIPGAAVTRIPRPPRGCEVRITKNGITGILAVLLMVVSARGGDLVTIKLEGTSIDILPDSVEVFVVNPGEAAEELVKKGGTKIAEDASQRVVSYRRIEYIFKTPEKTPAGSTQQFKPGDIIYTFNLETQEEAKSFAKRYLLEKKGTIPFGRNTKDLYVAKPGYFVFFPIKTTFYYCPLHPNQESDQEGACPTCGIPFVKTNGYR